MQGKCIVRLLSYVIHSNIRILFAFTFLTSNFVFSLRFFNNSTTFAHTHIREPVSTFSFWLPEPNVFVNLYITIASEPISETFPVRLWFRNQRTAEFQLFHAEVTNF